MITLALVSWTEQERTENMTLLGLVKGDANKKAAAVVTRTERDERVRILNFGINELDGIGTH